MSASSKFLNKLRFLTADSKYSLFTTKDILRLVIPLFFEQLLFRLVGSADTLMVAGLGEASISAFSLVDMFNNCVSGVIIALATGGAVVAAQYIGSGSLARARESAKQLLMILLAAGAAVLLIGELFPAEIIRMLYGELPADVNTEAVKYFKITLLTLPLITVYGGCTALFRVMNRTKVTMYVALVSNVINIVGNALLIYLFRMGVAGAAYATLFARLISMAVILYMIADKSKLIYIDFRSGFRVSWQFIKKILFIGVPGGIENGVFQFGRILVLGLIATYGTREIAANAVANTVDIFGSACGGVFALAVVTVIGRAVGAGDSGQIRYYVRKMMAWSYTSHILWNILVLAFTPLILLCFNKLDVETRQLAFYLILIHNALGMFMWPASFVFPNVLRSMNDVRVTMLISVVSMLIVRVGSSYLIARWIDSGVLAVWIAMILDWLVRITGFYWRYRSNAWTKLVHLKS
jgi:putative MATE family efflux protein